MLQVRTFLPFFFYIDTDNTHLWRSHRSRPKRLRQHPRKLLLRLRRVYAFLLGCCVFLFSVSAFPSSLHKHDANYASETKQKTLEEIASAFGDKVILPDEQGKDGDGDGKADSQHVEAVSVSVSGRQDD